MFYPEGMDQECQELADAMNEVPGITTTSSCCGHGKRPYRMWFDTHSLEALPDLLYWFDGCHCGYYSWIVKVYTDCSKCPAKFYIEGPTGEEAYEQSKGIAKFIIKDQREINS